MRAFHARDWGSNPHSSTLTPMVLFSQSLTIEKRLKYTNNDWDPYTSSYQFPKNHQRTHHVVLHFLLTGCKEKRENPVFYYAVAVVVGAAVRTC